MKPDLSPGISRGWNRSQAPQQSVAGCTNEACEALCMPGGHASTAGVEVLFRGREHSDRPREEIHLTLCHRWK
jgi:hypothetical protein